MPTSRTRRLDGRSLRLGERCLAAARRLICPHSSNAAPGRLVALVAAAGLALLATGCRSHRAEPPVVSIPYYIDHDALPGHIQSVSVLPLANDTSDPAVAEGMTSAFYAALLDRRVFRVVAVPPAEASAEAGGADPRVPLTLRDVARMRRALGTDAVVLGAINQFAAYPHMKIGLTIRIVDLRDGRVLWAVNHVWDAGDKDTQGRVEGYFRTVRAGDYEPIGWRLATVSPLTFRQFVAWEMAGTLPSGPVSRPRG